MVQIAFNLKGKENVICHEGLQQDGVFGNGPYEVPDMYSKFVPSLKHNKDYIRGVTDCIEFIDATFGLPSYLIPRNKEKRDLTYYVEHYAR
jgi:hypothetical protein